MSWTWLDLLLFTGAVYGLAWLITRSKLFAPIRRKLEPVPFLGALVTCVVCTGTWVGMGLALLLPWTSLFSPGLRLRTPLDLVVIAGWVLAACWGLGRVLGDAD